MVPVSQMVKADTVIAFLMVGEFLHKVIGAFSNGSVLMSSFGDELLLI